MQPSPQVHHDNIPLLYSATMLRAFMALSFLALLTLALCIGGRWLGSRIALAGNSDSTSPVAVTIGRDSLSLAANVIRFPSQRRNGVAERVDLYLTWPDMQGYGKSTRQRFDDLTNASDLVFIQLTEATMSRDMSGRLAPIYAHLMDGPAEVFRSGLTRHRLKKEAGYADEVLLTAARPAQPDYVVRCILPSNPARATSGDCQRDVKVGRDLSVLYRFSSAHLDDWQQLDDAVRDFVSRRLVSEQADKRRPDAARND